MLIHIALLKQLCENEVVKKIAVTLTLLVIVICCGSWGFLMHRSINQLAVYPLPQPLRSFMWANMEYLVKESVRPDQRRNKDSTEAPKHFIDLEAYGPEAANKMPLLWKDAVARYGKDSLFEWGYVPYQIMMTQEALTRAFKNKNRDSILYYAADLGHYISDAHVPLHTTINYDGQLTNQKGLHSLWESTVPELNITDYYLYTSHKARYLKNPEREIWKGIRKTFKLVPQVFAIEKEVSKNFVDSTKYRIQMRNGREVRSYSTAFARAYGARIKKAVNDQTLASVKLLTDMWYTAWVNGGKPSLHNLTLLTGAQKDSLQKETQYFKKNTLIKNGKLLSKKPQTDRE